MPGQNVKLGTKKEIHGAIYRFMSMPGILLFFCCKTIRLLRNGNSSMLKVLRKNDKIIGILLFREQKKVER